jgi:protein DGCR14
VRDDLPLDAFQANYTSEDNASFVQIVDAENRQRKEERWGWAWEAERKAEIRRLKGEEKRKMILDAATSGGWVVDGNGRRLIGGLGEGGRDRPEGEAWEEVRMIEASAVEDSARPQDTGETSSMALVKIAASGALVKRVDDAPPSGVTEQAVPEGHPLQRALAEAGLPATALVSAEDGAIVPHREFSSGEGDGRGRGETDRVHRGDIEKQIMGEEESREISLGGSGVDQWPYKVGHIWPCEADRRQ